MLTMRAYQLTIKTEGGQYYRCHGLFATDWDAIDAGMDLCPGATHVTPRRLP